MKSRIQAIKIALTFLFMLFPAIVAAEETSKISYPDTAWIMVSSALVMLMLPGLALFYGGMVRRKNVLSTLMHCFIPLGVITMQWVLFGYSLAFGNDTGHFVGDLSKAFFMGIDFKTLSGTIPEYLFSMLQLMFAIITAALISGGMAERVSFKAYIAFIFIWSTVVYDPSCHWVWGEVDGWEILEPWTLQGAQWFTLLQAPPLWP
jgi:Amt family ammonium transporter